MQIRFDRFPGGMTKALTMSFDDGRTQDRRLVEKLNTYGLKSTFHLNSGKLGEDRYITAEEAAGLFAGHEVSAHTVTHPFLEQTPPDRVVMELMEDRAALEAIVGYPVRGMSYPFGTWNERVVQALPAVGIEYARTTNSHGTFRMPSNLLLWDPTCHHKHMMEQADNFLAHQPRYPRLALLYVWGHSYEFDNDNNWDLIDRFGERVGARDDIWYATNAEIVEYMRASERLRFSVTGRFIHNPSAISVWVSAGSDIVEIRGGQVVSLT
jgi:peptidoglycan-N-acetylglucosamine deacetylase